MKVIFSYFCPTNKLKSPRTIEDGVHKRKCLEEGILEEVISDNRWAMRKIEQD